MNTGINYFILSNLKTKIKIQAKKSAEDLLISIIPINNTGPANFFDILM